jgi:adenylosuccinate synthase
LGPDGWRNLAVSGGGELPGEVLEFVRRVEKYVGARISMVSVGGDVKDTIALRVS